MTQLTTILGLAMAMQSPGTLSLAVCLPPQGEVTIVRNGNGHPAGIRERLLAGDKVICGPTGTLTCYDFGSKQRLVFQPKSVVVVEARSLKVKSGKAPVRKGSLYVKVPRPGNGAGVFNAKGVSRLQVSSPAYAQRERPTQVTWMWNPQELKPTEFRIRILQPIKIGGVWDTAGPINDPVFTTVVKPTESSVAIPGQQLEAGVPYSLEVTATTDDGTVSSKSKFWVLTGDELAAVRQSETDSAGKSDTDTRSMLAFLYWQVGFYPEAQQIYKELYAAQPGNSSLIRAIRQLDSLIGAKP